MFYFNSVQCYNKLTDKENTMRYLVTYTNNYFRDEKRTEILNSLEEVKAKFTGQTALNYYSNIHVYEIANEVKL